jgi:hypothetical protein
MLKRFANVTLIYPLIALSLLYGQWLLSWYMIGHRPSPLGDDDPKSIAVARWLHPITLFTLAAIIPATVLAAFCNAAYIIKERPSAIQAALRLQAVVGLWLGMIMTFFTNPYQIMTWWFD